MKLLILLGSAREQRFGKKVADWYMEHVDSSDLFDQIEFIDLAEVDLPFAMEPKSPSAGRDTYTHDYTKKWSKKIDSADAFVFLTPEYNYSFSAVIKNALDHLYYEWTHKPATVVAWGGVGGARAIEALVQTLRAHEMTIIKKDIRLNPWVDVNEDGQVENESAEKAISGQLKLLALYAKALKPVREELQSR